MAAAAGEYDGALPEPVTREDQYWQKVIRKIEDGNATPEEIDAAIEAYLNSHDEDIVTEQELSDALGRKVDKETGKGLTDINYSADEQAKVTAAYEARHTHQNKAVLDGITTARVEAWDAAEVNVNADWESGSGDSQILNKPDLSIFALADDMSTSLAGKVDKETGKSLMTNDEHTKLNGIETGAEVNVQADWTQDNSNADDYIKNKPANLVQDASYVHTDNNFTNAEKAKADGAIQSTEKGAAGGVAELDATGKVPTSQLPAYVSDVYEGYLDTKTTGKFYSDAQFQNEIQGQPNKIYVSLDTNLSYRWGGTGFREISPSIALGTTSETAYRGDLGNADHIAIGTLASLNTSEKSNLVAAINELQISSVSADPNRGLSENDFTDALKSKLDGIENGAEVNVQSDWNQSNNVADDYIKNKPENLVQDASYVHTDNNFTTEEKAKLSGIEAGAEVNQNTFSKIKVGSTTVAADAKQDTLELVAGSNVTITPDATNDKITIAATDTVYTHPTSSVTAGTYGSATQVPKVTVDAQGHVTGVTTTAITGVTPASHAHGNVTNAGAITAAGVALANGDALVFADASDSNKLKKTSITVGTETTTYLRNDGKWAALDLSSLTFDDTPTQNSNNPVKSGGIYVAINGTILYENAAGYYSFDEITTLADSIANYKMIEVITVNSGCFKSPVINNTCTLYAHFTYTSRPNNINALRAVCEKWVLSGTTLSRVQNNNYDRFAMRAIIKADNTTEFYYANNNLTNSEIGIYRIFGYK